MRLTILVAALVGVTALPCTSVAQAPTTREENWKNYIYNMTYLDALMPICQLMGYTGDVKGAKTAFGMKIAEGPQSGVSHDQAAAYVVELMKEFNPPFAAHLANMQSPDAAVSAKAFRSSYGKISVRCDEFAKFSPYLDPGPFQLSGQPQTYENFLAFQKLNAKP